MKSNSTTAEALCQRENLLPELDMSVTEGGKISASSHRRPLLDSCLSLVFPRFETSLTRLLILLYVYSLNFQRLLCRPHS